MLNPTYHSKYSYISVIDCYRNSFVNMRSHCCGSISNTAPSVYRINYWYQDYIDIKDCIGAGISTGYVNYHGQKGKDSTEVFSNVNQVDYISINSGKLWGNIVYVHPDEVFFWSMDPYTTVLSFLMASWW